MKIVDRFGSRPGAELVRLPQGGERLLAVEHAAALLVNEQTAFRVVCTPELLPQLALGRLLTGRVDRLRRRGRAGSCLR